MVAKTFCLSSFFELFRWSRVKLNYKEILDLKFWKYMKSILFVLDYFTPHRWWVENVFENIIQRLDKKWYKIFILTSRFDKSLPGCEQNWNVKIYRVWSSRISFMMRAIKIGKKVLEENKIDIIHASTYWWAIPAAILAKKFDKKVILTVHEIFGKLWYKYKWVAKWFLYKVFETIIFKFKYDIYHCVSHNTENELIAEYNVDKKKVCVIHNWVDYDFWDPNKVEDYEIKSLRARQNWWDKFVFLYFGHAGKSKWIDYLVEVLPELSKLENVEIVLNIIDSKRTRKTISKIKKIKWNNIKLFNGMAKDDLRVLVASCDSVIAPSISEWFGSVHTEACAMWKILITSKTSAIPEVVSWKVRFIKPGSSKEIIEAAKDVIEWKYKKIPIKTFDWDKNVGNIERLYESFK